MTGNDLAQLGLYLALLIALTPPLGAYMAGVFSGRFKALAPVERGVCILAGVDPAKGMSWRTYAAALLAFNALGFGVVLVLQLTQAWLPLNPQNLPNVGFWSAFNTAASFMTNTNWQGYAGETTLSYFTQMVGLSVQNFVSAATGVAVAVALARGLAGRSTHDIGNFWVDLTRSTLYILLPLSLILAVALVSEGVVQSFGAYVTVHTLSGGEQVVPLGPAASQIAIKMLGTNGGGFFNANSAHPFENPTPLTNFLEALSILLIPAALTDTFGRLVGNVRQGWSLFAAMTVLFVGGLAFALWSQLSFGTLEGQELRFGPVSSVLWAVATTAASNGSVNAMHSSLTPLTGLVALVNMQLGEVIFGGVGAGLYGMLMHVLVTVFVAGLMVGRTPEYLGKKIESLEVRLAMAAILIPNAVILVLAPLAVVSGPGLASLSSQGPHGLSEILYAFSSAANNNGSAFAGLNANTDFYNVALGVAMLVGRFAVIVPALGIAGSLAAKRITPPSAGTFPTDRPLFVALLIAVVLIVGALTFLPALSLGPIVEHFLMVQGAGF